MEPDNGASSVTRKQVITVSLFTTAYLLLSALIVGFKPDQVFLAVVVNVLFYSSVITRKFVLGFLIFIVYWIVFDYMKAYPNYNVSTVHIADLYNFEKKVFGITLNGKLVTPNEYWLTKSNSLLDVVGGIFYLCWIPVPLGFAAYLFFKNRRQFLYFSLTFVLVNFLGFIVYYSYPAAPPWYIQQHGFNFIPGTHSNPAGLARFDQLVHAGVFKSIYSKGSNVFAAMPSLHSSYPVIVLYYGLKNGYRVGSIFFTMVMLGIWFTAVYASHHYITDVVAGIICACCGILFFNLLLKKWRLLTRIMDRYYATIR